MFKQVVYKKKNSIYTYKKHITRIKKNTAAASRKKINKYIPSLLILAPSCQ